METTGIIVNTATVIGGAAPHIFVLLLATVVATVTIAFLRKRRMEQDDAMEMAYRSELCRVKKQLSVVQTQLECAFKDSDADYVYPLKAG